MSWSGFSEEDIIRLKSGNNQLNAKKEDKKIKTNRRADQQYNAKPKNLVKNISGPVYEVPEEAKLSMSKEVKVEDKKEEIHVTNGEDNKVLNESVDNSKNDSKHSITVDLSKIEKRVIDLDEFQARQKLIEEQNRKRKELLAKALADRTKRTEEEARRLKEIQNEFKKLDALLSNDVSILRHQIEIASLEFMEAQKKYHRIEKEFLDAKLNLHQKLERKEMLTEHLCAIIEKNEERKAEKLSELMNRLEVNTEITTTAEDKIEDNVTKENVPTNIENNKSIDDNISKSVDNNIAKSVDNNIAKSVDDNKNVDNNVNNLIDEVKNRREIKIDLQPNKNNENEKTNDNNDN